MAITTEAVPTKGGNIASALREAEAEAKIAAQPTPPEGKTTEQIDAERVAPRKTVYTVLTGPTSEGPFEAVGVYEVAGGQRNARLAAIEADAKIKQAILDGNAPYLVAVANWSPVQPGVKKADPTITA